MKKNNQRVKSNLLSIDIGSQSIKLATGQLNGDKLKVTSLTKVALSKDIVSHGRIVDFDALKDRLTHAIKQEKIKQKDVVITCECQEIIKRELLVQKVDDADQMELIKYEVGQYLPIDIDAYELQYKVLDEVTENDVQKIKILLGAMPKDMVSELYQLIIECGLTPRYLDMHSNSIDKLINFTFGAIALEKTVAMIDFGNQLIDISLFENGEYKFNRLLRYGISEFDRILVDNFNIGLGEAIKRKKMASVTSLVNALQEEDFDPNDEKGKLLLETANYFNECAEEIEKVFKYYTSRVGDNRIDQIYLYGGGSQAKDIAKYFRERFEIPTEVMNEFSGIDLATRTEVKEVPIFINAVGALIRQ